MCTCIITVWKVSCHGHPCQSTPHEHPLVVVEEWHVLSGHFPSFLPSFLPSSWLWSVHQLLCERGTYWRLQKTKLYIYFHFHIKVYRTACCVAVTHWSQMINLIFYSADSQYTNKATSLCILLWFSCFITVTA